MHRPPEFSDDALYKRACAFWSLSTVTEALWVPLPTGCFNIGRLATSSQRVTGDGLSIPEILVLREENKINTIAHESISLPLKLCWLIDHPWLQIRSHAFLQLGTSCHFMTLPRGIWVATSLLMIPKLPGGEEHSSTVEGSPHNLEFL